MFEVAGADFGLVEAFFEDGLVEGADEADLVGEVWRRRRWKIEDRRWREAVERKQQLDECSPLLAGGGWRVEVLPGLNHMLQHAATGSPLEYTRIEQTVAPEVLEIVGRELSAYTPQQ